MKRSVPLLKSRLGGAMTPGFYTFQGGLGPDGRSVFNRPKYEQLGDKRDLAYGGHQEVTSVTREDPEIDMTRNDSGIPPYPNDVVHGSSTSRRTGFLHKFPTRRYPNPKRHRPILATPQINLMTTHTSAHSLVSRNALPLEKKGKKIIMKTEYKRPLPPVKRTRRELYLRVKHGLFDLDRILPPLWGPQEGYKLDRDEWLFKLLYFLHPILEEDLCAKAREFPHNPFDGDKDVVLSLERLVSREYARRVKGGSLHHPNVETEEHYWTLMPDELEFGEKVVVEEHYLQTIKEGKPIDHPVYPIRDEMLQTRYQEKHNTYMALDDVTEIEALERYIEFCKEERENTVKKLAAINCTEEFPEDTEEDEGQAKQVYPDPPTLLSNYIGKIRWHATGHWGTSIPDGQMSQMVPS